MHMHIYVAYIAQFGYKTVFQLKAPKLFTKETT